MYSWSSLVLTLIYLTLLASKLFHDSSQAAFLTLEEIFHSILICIIILL